MSEDTPQRPQPTPRPEAVPYFDALREGRIILQFCVDCEQFQFPPRVVCRGCLGDRLEWRDSTGAGEVLTYSEVHRPPAPAFAGSVPYVVGVIRLEEGVQMVSQIEPHDEVRIGTAVKARFEDIGAYSVPIFVVGTK